jgi:precorrin-6B methylase 2
MATPTTANRPNPERIFNTLNAFQQSAALKAGIDLDLFTLIGQGASTPALLAEKTKGSERGLRILCDYLTIQGFLQKEAGKYALTQESAIFLDRRSPACLASMATFLLNPMSQRHFGALTEAVKKGGNASGDGDNSEPKDELWVNFARSMAPLVTPAAEFMAALIGAAEAKPMKVLDVAAGHGMHGITMARHNPNAQIVSLDWPAVLEVVQENARKFGVAERLSIRPGSAFEAEFGDGYDYVLLTNILHHFDVPTCETLIRRAHAALKPGGKAVTLEFVPNEDRVSPPTAAAFSLVMLASTDSGDAYTFAEYEKMFRNVGFARTTLHPVPDSPQQVLISEK